MDRVAARELWMLRELRLPPFDDASLTELAGFAGESGSEGAAIVLELIRVVRICRDVVAQGSGIVRA